MRLWFGVRRRVQQVKARDEDLGTKQGTQGYQSTSARHSLATGLACIPVWHGGSWHACGWPVCLCAPQKCSYSARV